MKSKCFVSGQRVLTIVLSTGIVLACMHRGRAADTIQDFSAIFPPPVAVIPAVLSVGNVSIIEGWDGRAVRLTPNANDLNNNGIAFNQLVAGSFTELKFDFQLRFSRGAGGADGIGFAYAHSGTFGDDNSEPFPIDTWAIGEEPNLTDSFGVGFDIFNNTDQNDNGENSISLHLNGQLIESIGIDDSEIPSMETRNPLDTSITIAPKPAGGANVTVSLRDTVTNKSFVPFQDYAVDDFDPYDGRAVFRARTGGANSEQMVDNFSITHRPTGGGAPTVIKETFDAFSLGLLGDPPLTPLAGGTPFVKSSFGNPPGARIVNEGPGPGRQPGHLELTGDELLGQANFVAFDKTSNNHQKIVAEFDFKISNPTDEVADGFSFALTDTQDNGETGPLRGDRAPWTVAEEPGLTNTLGVGFDTFDNDEEGLVDPDGCGRGAACVDQRANHVSLHWNRRRIDLGFLPLDQIDLANDRWNHATLTAEEVAGGMMVSLTLTDGSDQSVHVVHDKVLIADAKFVGGARAAFAGRTGGQASFQLIDNLKVSFGDDGVLRGDFNANGSLDAGDLDEMATGMMANDPRFDLDNDGDADLADRTVWVRDLKKTWMGDADLNGEFSSSDFVAVFIAGKFETNTLATWSQGDWNGDKVFSSTDFVTAFIDGGFEKGPRAGVAAVPEPTGLFAFLMTACGLFLVVRRHRQDT